MCIVSQSSYLLLINTYKSLQLFIVKNTIDSPVFHEKSCQKDALSNKVSQISKLQHVMIENQAMYYYYLYLTVM